MLWWEIIDKNVSPFIHLCFLPLEIAKSLAKCVLHFNTFGGNPVACAIGSAVLEVCSSRHVALTCFTKWPLQGHTLILMALSHYIIEELGLN